MNNLLHNIEDILLMGPGPSCIYPSVYEALSKPTLGYLDPHFLSIMDAIQEQLRTLLHTQNYVTLPISGTGSAGMESSFVNLVEAGDPVLILINGVFGARMKEVAERLGADVDALEFDWGTPIIVDQVAEQLRRKHYKLVAMIHAETSTGVCNPVAEIGTLLKGSNSIFLVDAVTSLGGIKVAMDEWGIDALYSGSQKCLSCPPGLAPLSFSEKAMDAVRTRNSKVPNWYLDVSLIIKYWSGEATRGYHHTAPMNMLYGLYQALYNVLEEGVDAVHARHLAAHQQLVAGLEELGLSMLVDAPHRLPMLNSVKVSEKMDEAGIRKTLRTAHKIEIGAGLGPFAGKIWRIGVMGHTARPENITRFVDALRQVMQG